MSLESRGSANGMYKTALDGRNVSRMGTRLVKPDYLGGGGASSIRIGKLKGNLANLGEGQLVVWERAESGQPFTATEKEIDVYNETGMTLLADKMMYSFRVIGATLPLVWPYRLEDCIQDDGGDSVTP